MTDSKFFTEALLDWHHHDNDRVLPWKNEKNPYKIWLSEIILQQTTSAQGLKYYHKFLDTFPTVRELAAAEDAVVYKMWEGLGYYTRCKNLLKTARIISSEYGGVFPADYKTILSLPGIGPYTASALASFAFGLSHAVVDGNVYRVLSRYFGNFLPIDTGEGKKSFQALAQKLLPPESPAAYNQAIMDFGATICTPKKPMCHSCPLSVHCYTFQKGIDTNELPVKSKKTEKKLRYFNYFIIENEKQEIYFERRAEKDIWQNLFQPYLIETQEKTPEYHLLADNIKEYFSLTELSETDIRHIGSHKQTLTHRIIISDWYYLKIGDFSVPERSDAGFFTKKNIKKLAFPETIFSFMSKNPYF